MNLLTGRLEGDAAREVWEGRIDKSQATDTAR